MSETSDIAEYNLARDKNVVGEKWLSTYGNYFSDKENIQNFIDVVKPHLPDRELDILYVASASGLLGEEFLQNLGKGHLTLIDISQKHLDENKNPNTQKFCLDLLKMNLGKKFDLVIMRSSLDYFPSKDLQTRVLKVVRNHLKEGGLFINQPAYISDTIERDLISKVYNDNDKIGNRFFQSEDLKEIYKEAGFDNLEKIEEGKPLVLTEQEHTERYGLNPEDIGSIRKAIKEGMNNAKVTESGYSLKFEFPIFLTSL